jgi:hypothetical protein
MSPASADNDREQELLSVYPSPRADTFALTQSTVQERRLTRNNYRARMHELLAVEEMARYEQVRTARQTWGDVVRLDSEPTAMKSG